MRRRNVITGMGVVTPLGTTIQEMFQNLIAGKSGIGAITRFNAKSFPTTFAAEIKNFDLAKYVKDASPWKDCGVNSCFAAAAAQQALEHAGLLDNAKEDYINAIYFYEQYHSKQCWFTVEQARLEWREIKTKTNQRLLPTYDIVIGRGG